MSFVLLLLALATVGVVGAVAAGRITGGLEAPTTSLPRRPLPADDLVPPDVDAVRFSLGLRGYRMDEVDAVLDRLRDELAERDRRIAELTAAAGDAPGDARPKESP